MVQPQAPRAFRGPRVLVVVLVALTGSFLVAGEGARAQVAVPQAPAETLKVPKSCVLKGKRLWGKVQVVSAFPDLKVQVVSAFPDLKVQVVDAFPDKCGKWQMVTSFPDLKVQFVDAFPDLKIQYVTAFPGVP
jgi:hypothetical protein